MRQTLFILALALSMVYALDGPVPEQHQEQVPEPHDQTLYPVAQDEQDYHEEFQADQGCYNHLFKLDGSYHSKSVTPYCEPWVNEHHEQQYKVKLQYLAPYWQDPTCTKEAIVLGGEYMTQSDSGSVNTFHYNAEENSTYLYFKHSDIDHTNGDPKYNCVYYHTKDSYIWACPISLQIYHQGAVQFVYNFEFKIVLNRNLTDSIQLFIQPNVVIGDCCVNELNVESELVFCTDANCDYYLAEPFYVMRQQVFYVEHKITTQGFKHYYLDLIDCKLHGLIPDIINVDKSKAGRVILALASQVAYKHMNLQVISQVKEHYESVGGGQRRRRMLQGRDNNITNEDDYKVKGTKQVSVSDEPEQNQEVKSETQVFQSVVGNKNIDNETQKTEEIEEDSDLSVEEAIGLAIGCTLLFVILVALTGFCVYKKLSNKSKEEKYLAASEKSSQFDAKETKKDSIAVKV